MAFLCGFQNFMITTIQRYFWRFVVNKSSFTLEEQHSKHIYGPYMELRNCGIILAPLAPYSFYNRQYKDEIKSCVLLYFMYWNYYQTPIGFLETFLLNKKFHKNTN